MKTGKAVQRESVKTPTHPPFIQLQGDLVFLSPRTHVTYGIDITFKQGVRSKCAGLLSFISAEGYI